MISLVSRTETLPLWSRFENYLNTFLLLGHLTNSSPLVLFSPVQILAEMQWDTLPSSQDAPLHDLSGAVGSVPVPLDPAGKVFTYLFSSVVQLKQNNFIGL